jgi:hypothetical protein
MSLRDEIAQVCRQHDRFMAEQAREAQWSPYAQKSGPDHGLVFKTHENAPAPAADDEQPPSEGVRPYPADFDTVLRIMGEGVAMYAAHRLAPIERELAELRAKLDVLTTIMAGGTTKSADVIDLPDWRRRDVA